MTTTMPFSRNTSSATCYDGSFISYIDGTNKKTWRSGDATSWYEYNWAGQSTPYDSNQTWTTTSYNFCLFNGVLWRWIILKNKGLNYFEIYSDWSADGVSWNQGSMQPVVELPGGIIPEFNSFDRGLSAPQRCESPIAHNGKITKIWGSASGVLLSSINGGEWSTPLVISFPTSILNVLKFVSYGSSIYAIPLGASLKTVYRSDNNGVTWTAITTNWGLDNSYAVDCIVTTDGLLVVQENNETWTSLDGITWTRKTYTKPANSMANGKICALGMDLFIVGCGASRNTVFKLVSSSAPVAIPL